MEERKHLKVVSIKMDLVEKGINRQDFIKRERRIDFQPMPSSPRPMKVFQRFCTASDSCWQLGINLLIAHTALHMYLALCLHHTNIDNSAENKFDISIPSGLMAQ